MIMGKYIIKIEKEDINSFNIGINIGFKTVEGLEIIFSREALDELLNDYNNIKIGENENINHK